MTKCQRAVSAKTLFPSHLKHVQPGSANAAKCRSHLGHLVIKPVARSSLARLTGMSWCDDSSSDSVTTQAARENSPCILRRWDVETAFGPPVPALELSLVLEVAEEDL